MDWDGEGDGRLDKAETQEWMDIDGEEDSTWVDRQSRAYNRRSKSADPHPNPNPIPTWLPEALQNLLSTDDEDEPDVRDLLREGRRVKERARRREREEREREEERKMGGGEEEGENKGEGERRMRRRKKTRPFPMRNERERKEREDGVRSPNPVCAQ